jgi:putative transposase
LIQAAVGRTGGFEAMPSKRMGSAGDGFDHAMAESCFATLECERLTKRPFKSQAEARIAIFEYLGGFHNPHRFHFSIGCLSPVNFERRYAPRKPSKLTRPRVH